MEFQLSDFKRKEVINIADGSKIGYPDDIVFELETASVKGLVIFGRLRLFGLLGRDKSVTVPWENVEVIGSDTLLVNCTEISDKKQKTGIKSPAADSRDISVNKPQSENQVIRFIKDITQKIQL